METGAQAVQLVDQRDGRGRHLLFLDADLGATAAGAGPLVTPVLAGEADMTIAAFTTRVKLGGHGLVVRLSSAGIRRAAGWSPAQPLNGQRCLTRAAFEAARPLARGFGVETALTIDLVRKGYRVRRDRSGPRPPGHRNRRCAPRCTGPASSPTLRWPSRRGWQPAEPA